MCKEANVVLQSVVSIVVRLGILETSLISRTFKEGIYHSTANICFSCFIDLICPSPPSCSFSPLSFHHKSFFPMCSEFWSCLQIPLDYLPGSDIRFNAQSDTEVLKLHIPSFNSFFLNTKSSVWYGESECSVGSYNRGVLCVFLKGLQFAQCLVFLQVKGP